MIRRTAIALVASATTITMTAAADPFPTLPDATARSISYSDLPQWAADDHLAAWRLFERHCTALAARAPALREGAKPPEALRQACRAALDAGVSTAPQARVFLERWFDPVEITPASGAGFLTGYYEPETDGSLVRTDAYRAPLLARPPDLVTIPQGETRPGVPEGFAAARQRADGGLEAYPDRAAIWRGELGDLAPPILWLRDEVEVFFMQVQGSGRVRLPDGRTVRIAYAGRNGHPYSSIGRIMVRDGLLPLAEAQLEGIKGWLRAHPEEGRRVMGMNASYVFFRIADELPEEAGPIGGAGLPLTPWRSIAVDRNLWAYGLPVWLETTLPRGDGPGEPFAKLTIAEDTGSAILGPARADLYHGSGAEAGRRAGALRHPMRFVVLWPRGAPR